MGRLIDITGAVGTCYLGVARNARVIDAVAQSRWNIRGQRSRHFHALYESIQNIQVPQEDQGRDKVLWKHAEDTYKAQFSSVRTWDQIRVRKATVPWSKCVWFTQGVPRYSFIVWLAVKNILSTGDRMRTWGIQQGCVMCGEWDETRDHVFFACPYTYSVWDRLAGSLCGRRINPDWSLTLQFVTNNNLQLMDKILLKMVFQTCVYYMWKESNERRHQRGFRTVDQAIRIVDKAIRNRISSLRYGPVHRFAGLLQHWLEVFDRT